MITINGRHFAQSKKELDDSCVGVAKVYRRVIYLEDLSGQRVGVINQEGVIGKASRINGSWWYSYGEVPLLGEFPSYAAKMQVAEDLAIGRDRSGFVFK